MINFLASFLELKTLDLSNNHIKIVRENDFLTTFESLESLNLNRNQISTLEYGLFGQLKALKVLKFSRTFLSYINLTAARVIESGCGIELVWVSVAHHQITRTRISHINCSVKNIISCTAII